ncbi:unnamed protein product [Gongylonema pulchrum]|uniref:STAS domain-containing protein n=1 Tax=Gongylonema pulchrum TaxID=637853 RepID=A0A183EN04_9BILA|nr:unnamed protein product [Gongylonema pulchrum]
MIGHNIIRKNDDNSTYNFVVRLRGIPFNASADDVKEFFNALIWGLTETFIVVGLGPELLVSHELSCQNWVTGCVEILQNSEVFGVLANEPVKGS